MKLSFRQRLFIYFALLFTVFATGIAVFEHSREKNFKTLILEERLGIYTNIIQTAITDTTTNYESALDKVHSYLPAQLRISVIAQQGNVLYDNTVKDVSKMENHAGRVEIRTAEINGTGSDIRESATKHMPYFYYARKIQSGFIRVALPDDVQMRQFLKADNLFLYFLLGLFVISIFIIHSITSQVGASIKRLRDFALSPDRQDIVFGEDELGETGKKISENYLQLESGRKDLWQVKNKLLQHILISGEGICFFSNNKQVEFYNALFIQYLHQLIDEPHSDVSAVFSDDIFADFLEVLEKSNETTFETQLKKNGKTFSFRANLFDDKSIEVILSDVTKQEKTRQLKVEMTGNIAHELRTPVTSIRAYLETIIRQNLSEEQQLHFITKAYAQSLTLSEMIRDMSVLAKLE
ncbi:MAG TPA: histidine kinase dimerization/phospho-acceptor domain-containing protein, partial [Saprospiraceae bacterium]|nr:histidine kinase dimerization/phospho-acceptor domain-containing protein [Saprospiraceae bacterium]